MHLRSWCTTSWAAPWSIGCHCYGVDVVLTQHTLYHCRLRWVGEGWSSFGRQGALLLSNGASHGPQTRRHCSLVNGLTDLPLFQGAHSYLWGCQGWLKGVTLDIFGNFDLGSFVMPFTISLFPCTILLFHNQQISPIFHFLFWSKTLLWLDFMYFTTSHGQMY